MADFIKNLFDRAVKLDASDIHIQPGMKDLMVRYRIDGIMHENSLLALDLKNVLTSRIKILSNYT